MTNFHGEVLYQGLLDGAGETVDSFENSVEPMNGAIVAPIRTL
jgi:hypothetical protein